MTLNKLYEDMKLSMKDKNKIKTSVIKEIIGEAKNNAIANKREISEEDINTSLNKLRKICQDQIDSCPADRTDKLDEYHTRLNIVIEYLPKQLTEAEVTEEVAKLLKDKDIKNKGEAMKIVMPILKGKADGKLINACVSKYF